MRERTITRSYCEYRGNVASRNTEYIIREVRETRRINVHHRLRADVLSIDKTFRFYPSRYDTHIFNDRRCACKHRAARMHNFGRKRITSGKFARRRYAGRANRGHSKHELVYHSSSCISVSVSPP